MSSHENNSSLKKTSTSAQQPAASAPAPEDAAIPRDTDPVPSGWSEPSQHGQLRTQSAKQRRGRRKESANPPLPQVRE